MLGTNVLDNSTDPTTHCYDVNHLFGEPVGENFSWDEKKAYKCSTALIWAKNHGIKEHPEMYVNYTGQIFPNSSWADFQCMLYHMRGGDELGSGQNCTYPCTSTLPQCPQMGAGINTNKNNETALADGGSSGSSGSWPVWGWILLALGILGIIGGIAVMMLGGSKKEQKPKKKKRATATKAATAPSSPEVPTPPAMTAPPVYVAAAPTVMTAPPVYVAAPTVQTRAIPAPMAMPIQTVADPVQMATPVPTFGPTFDQLDRNHDGVVTRAEFNAAMGR
jgi:hypothetical protein